jgi:hypothetical protein
MLLVKSAIERLPFVLEPEPERELGEWRVEGLGLRPAEVVRDAG